MSEKLKCRCITHIGHRRRMNQDNLVLSDRFLSVEEAQRGFQTEDEFSLMSPVMIGVFDGMGGDEYGEVAAFLAARYAAKYQLSNDVLSDLMKYCKDTNQIICDYASGHQISKMGTTAAILVFLENEIYICNIGDSKIFSYANGKMNQLSEDHVLAAPYGRKPPLSQDLGIEPSVFHIVPYVNRMRNEIGKRYLICSDGLTDMIGIEEIKSILAENKEMNAADQLVQCALEHGGRDNITVILCCIE